ncbi:hypothetical protein [Fictibacillus solisalsi]|uniref:hypothetical protein n=1 Tax=Fictibacillus solisalsi TaxID=459525 RepID=UPI000B7F46D4|nr:hypothetical protein [Fictibacillus solisalsi]
MIGVKGAGLPENEINIFFVRCNVAENFPCPSGLAGQVRLQADRPSGESEHPVTERNRLYNLFFACQHPIMRKDVLTSNGTTKYMMIEINEEWNKWL